MKWIFTLLFLLPVLTGYSQVSLSPKDFDNLVALGVLYSNNTNEKGDAYVKSVDSLRTPVLDHMVETFLAMGRGDKTILENRFLKRPGDDELLMWYVIREIHYNRQPENKLRKADTTVAREVLSQQIDSRFLLDNYYYRIHGGIAMLFNKANLSKYDIRISELGLKDETERAIFFLNMVDALIRGRFRVLSHFNNYKEILSFAKKMPRFDGKDYFYFCSFGYPDFEWVGYDKKESYNGFHIGNLYETLTIHYVALMEKGKREEAQKLYYGSVLYMPEYFKYSEAKDELQKMYEKMR